MELPELEQHERVVLAAMVKYAVRSGAPIAEEEAEEIDMIAEAWGWVDYQMAINEANQSINSLESLKAALATVTRPEAQNLIYGTLLELSTFHSIDPREGMLLDLLTEAWGVKEEIDYDASS